jgi:hypothetical protein
MLEIESEETDLSRNILSRGLPPESARDHEMKHEKQFVVGLDDDAFAEPAQPDDRFAFDRGERRVNGAKEKRGGEADAGYAATENPRLQGVEI